NLACNRQPVLLQVSRGLGNVLAVGSCCSVIGLHHAPSLAHVVAPKHQLEQSFVVLLVLVVLCIHLHSCGPRPRRRAGAFRLNVAPCSSPGTAPEPLPSACGGGCRSCNARAVRLSCLHARAVAARLVPLWPFALAAFPQPSS